MHKNSNRISLHIVNKHTYFSVYTICKDKFFNLSKKDKKKMKNKICKITFT